MTFGNLEANFSRNIWNLFFHSGYLTLAEKYDEEEDDVFLKIPNEEILRMFSEMFIDVYFEDYDKFSGMTYALKTGDIETFRFEMKRILLENTGIFDVSGIYKEQFYHGLMLGLILKLRREYEITSNNFSGKGRYDLLLKPRNLLRRDEGIIFELKVVNVKEDSSLEEIQEKLKRECEIALKQIDDKEYVSALRNAGIEKVLKIGLAFCGKEFEVRFEREKI